MKQLLCIFIFLSISTVLSQTETQFSRYELDLETKGVLKDNRGEINKEFYDQYRSLLVGLRISDRSKVQTGLNVARSGNQDLVEIPLIFRYQVAEKLSIYGGGQLQISGNRAASAQKNSFNNLSVTTGLDYQFSKSWDAAVQFVLPVLENSNAPNTTFELSQPIRLRTGVKF